MVLVYKLLKGKTIEKPISKGKKIRDDDTESENSGFNLYSETEGESEDFSNKGKTKGKSKRTVEDSDLSNSEDESFDDKFIKRKKRKGMGRQTQRTKKTRKVINKVKRQILISSDEDTEVEKNDNKKGKEEDEMLDGDHGENLSTQRMQMRVRRTTLEIKMIVMVTLVMTASRVFVRSLAKWQKRLVT